MNNAERQERVVSPITVNADKGLYKAEYQKDGSVTAELHQSVTTTSYYSSKKVDSNMSDNLFGTQEFGYGEQKFESTENRVSWMIVPISATLAEVTKRVTEAFEKGARLYKVLANKPVLDDNQKYAIEQGLKTMDDFANSQVVRYPETDGTTANGTAGKLVLDNAGNVQYRRIFFSATTKEDLDLRNAEEVFVSPEIKAELQGVEATAGQAVT